MSALEGYPVDSKNCATVELLSVTAVVGFAVCIVVNTVHKRNTSCIQTTFLSGPSDGSSYLGHYKNTD